MGLKQIFLCGHSMGGYIAAKYASQYPNKVKSLALISPADIWPMPTKCSEKNQKIIKGYKFFDRHLYGTIVKDWTPGKSPIEALRKFGILSKFFVRNYVKSYKYLSDKEKEDMKNYLFQILMKPGTGEYAMPYLLLPVLFCQ